MVPNLVAQKLMIRMKMYCFSGNSVSKDQINYLGRTHNKNQSYHHCIGILGIHLADRRFIQFVSL
jgi:hypothetical protein